MRRITFWLTFGLLAAVLLAIPPSLHAQATIPVSGNKVVDNNRQPLTGQLVFTVTDASNNPVTYTPQGGSPTTATFTIPVVRGAVQNIGGFPPTIANPVTMSPANTRYRIQTQSTGGGTTYFTFPLTNINTSSFSYDGYIAPAGITISGAGIPTLNCNPSATYNNTLASDPYPWVCSKLQGDAAVYWTQNPSLNPSCQRGNDQAIASAINGTTFCIDANQAFITPGFVWAGPVPGTPPTQIGLVPLTTLCSTGGCGAGATLPSNAPVFGLTPLTSRASVLSDYVAASGTIWSGAPCTVGSNALLVNGQCGPSGGGAIPGTIHQQIFSAGGGTATASNATLDAAGNAQSLSNDGLKQAFLNQTTPTSNNGIANSLSAANNTVIIGPDYANVEGEYSGGSPCTYRVDIGCPPPFANNTILYDYRLPTYGTYAYNTNMGQQGGFWLYDRWISNRQAQASGTGSTIAPYQRDFEVTGSGKNGFGAAFGPDSFVGFQWNFEFMRRGIVNPITLQYQGMGVGDGHIWQNIVTNNRGCPDGSCEGFNTVRNQIGQNLTPMTTTANSTLAAGATLIQGTLLGNNPFPGDGTPYINASKGSAIFHIVASGNPGDTGAGDAGILTIDTLTLTPDNIGRVAAAVTVPPQYYGATTNVTVTVTGLTSAIVNTSTVCYANNTSANMDAYLESARVVSPGSFSGGTQTGLVLALRYSHGTNSYVVQGSHACTSIDIRANQFPGSLKGRQILRIPGALDATHLLYSRIGAGHWLQALSGYASTNIVAAAGVTLTRNGSNVVSVTVTDPFLVLTNDDIIVSGCANASFNGLFVTTSNDGSTLKWTNTGSAGTTTCSNAIEIQSQLNGLSVREAQLFPAVEIVNTVDPVTFANNFNLTVEPNTNFQVTAGDQLEDQVYSEVGQGLDHNLISFRSQISPSIADIIHNDTLFDQIPEGTTWYNISFEDAPNQYLGLGGTKPILNTLFEMEHSATPFNFIFHGFPTPLTALFTFNGCLFSCTDVRSKFDLFEIPINGGTYTQTIHQDTGLLDRTTANSTQRLTVQESPVGFSWSGIGTGASNNFFAVPSDTRSTIGGGAGTSSVIDQISSIIETTINGTGGASSHVIQTVAGWSVDVPATFVGLANGCATFASGVLGSTGVACGSGSAGVASINGTAGAFTFTGSGVSCTTTTCSFSGTGSGIGSITWALPSFLSASPTTISATGTQTFSLVTQSANTVFAGPASGSAAAPTFRSLVSLDIPNNGANTTGNAATATLATNSSAVGGVALSGLCQTGGTGCPTSGTGISGQTAGWAIEAATATTATGPFPMDDGITTTGFVTIHKNVQIVGTGTANGWLLPEGTAITGVALSAAFYPSSTTHRWMQNPNNIGALMIPGETAAITPGHLWAAAANGIDMVDGGTAGGGSSAGPLGTVQVAGASGAFAQGTGDANYQSVASTPLSGSQGGLQVIANSVVDQMAQFFTSDGTPYWCAGLGYCSLGVFAEDYTYSLIQNPSKFPTEINGVAGTSTIRNIVSKFIAQVDVHGQIPAAINSAGTGASVTYSGWDNNHAFYSGVAMYMIPLDCYVDWQKTGSTSCYTTYVNAIKTAQAYSPINGTSHLPTNVVGANEWMPQSLFLEEERSSGDVANASVLRAASDAVMSQMATAAGDSTNATFFSTDFTNVTTSIQSEFIDPTSHMLWAGTGQNKQIDMLTSGMAVWLSRFTGQNILTLAQQKAIGTFLHTNLATINYNGFFANTVTTGGAVTTWTTKGIIPSGGGGSGYTSDGCAAGVYQQGYWSLVTGMNAYALSLTNPTDVPTLLASFRDAASGGSGDPAWEYYDQAHGHSAAGCTPAFSSTATTPNLESPQGAAWVAANIVGPTAVAATLGTTDKYGAIVTGTASGAGSYINLCSVVTLSAGASCSGGVISITTGTTSFTISAIPGTFVNLILDINEYSTSGSAANLLVQFNGDAGANYNYQQTHSGSSTVSGFGNTSLTSAPIAAVGSNSAGGSAFTITLPFYAKTVNKFINSVGGQYAGTPPVSADTYIGSWNSTAAITSITFSLSGGNFGTGFMSIHATN